MAVDVGFLELQLRVEVPEVARERARDKEVGKSEGLNMTPTLGDTAGLVSDPMRVVVMAEESP